MYPHVGSTSDMSQARRFSPSICGWFEPTSIDICDGALVRFAGFSAEFLDRVAEPNGNIPEPDRYSLGKRLQYINSHDYPLLWDINTAPAGLQYIAHLLPTLNGPENAERQNPLKEVKHEFEYFNRREIKF